MKIDPKIAYTVCCIIYLSSLLAAYCLYSNEKNGYFKTFVMFVILSSVLKFITAVIIYVAARVYGRVI